MNGIVEACRRRSFSLEHLSDRQAASLVARLKYPEPTQPSVVCTTMILKRTNHILYLMSVAKQDASAKEFAPDEAVSGI
jgi:hypothetical protein